PRGIQEMIILENDDTTFTFEEMKMINETKKIMHMPELEVAATCVRLPVVSGHSESVYIEVEKEGVTVAELKSLLANAEGIVLQDNPEEQLYPMPATAVGKQRIHCVDDEVFEVGTVIVTTPPKEACKIIKGAEGTSLHKWSEQSVPVTVGALDIGLRQLPNPTHQFVLGLDQPIFFTNQSRAAKLSEDGSIAVSLIKYHNPVLEMNHIH
ncbi:Asd/ArgC dimerization domain-containing protein, partial [Bacillus sp. SS-TM]